MIFIDPRAVLEVKKNAEKSIVQYIISRSMTAKTNRRHSAIKSAVIMESSTLKDNMQNISDDLGQSVKGRFGKRVRETFKEQAEKTNEL